MRSTLKIAYWIGSLMIKRGTVTAKSNVVTGVYLFTSRGGDVYALFGCAQTQDQKLVKGFEYRKELSDEAI